MSSAVVLDYDLASSEACGLAPTLATAVSPEVLHTMLERYELTPAMLLDWEQQLGLSIARNPQGGKLYSPQHLTLFKNIKKHMALGRSLEQIKAIITLPPVQQSLATQPVNTLQGLAPANDPTNAPANDPANDRTVVSIDNATRYGMSRPLRQGAWAELTGLAFPEPVAEIQANPESMFKAEAEVDLETTPAYAEIAPTEAPLLEPYQQPLEAFFKEISPLPEAEGNLPEEAPQDIALAAPEQETPEPETTEPEAQLQTGPLTNEPTPDFSLVGWGALQENTPLEVSFHNELARQNEAQSHALQLLERLSNEKEALNQRLLEAEKLNSHLYNTNALFHRKVQELTELAAHHKAARNEEAQRQMMEAKALLQKQVIEAERALVEARQAHRQKQHRLQNQLQQLTHSLSQLKQELSQREAQINQLQQTLHHYLDDFNPENFIGTWNEQATLLEVVYDNFGLNLEPRRQNQRTIETLPSRRFANCAVWSQPFAYQSNPLWRRIETATLVYVNTQRLEGQLQVDYLLDGMPVSRALYSLVANRA